MAHKWLLCPARAAGQTAQAREAQQLTEDPAAPSPEASGEATRCTATRLDVAAVDRRAAAGQSDQAQ
jgi:hypothetical protein